MSGDLTATGNDAEFALGHDLLGAGVAPDGFGFGLLLHRWDQSSIPGNHDQWPGRVPPAPLGRPGIALAHTLPGPYPMIGDPILLEMAQASDFCM